MFWISENLVWGFAFKNRIERVQCGFDIPSQWKPLLLRSEGSLAQFSATIGLLGTPYEKPSPAPNAMRTIEVLCDGSSKQSSESTR